jgi:hypothetical protein
MNFLICHCRHLRAGSMPGVNKDCTEGADRLHVRISALTLPDGERSRSIFPANRSDCVRALFVGVRVSLILI